MNTKGIVTFLFLIAFTVFYFVNAENDIKPNNGRNIEIIDEREAVNIEDDFIEESEIIVFGNNRGELYSDLKWFLESQNYSFTDYSTSNSNFSNKLKEYKKEYKKSEGMSTNFRYYPIIFVKDRVFSGFSEKIKEEIRKTLEE